MKCSTALILPSILAYVVLSCAISHAIAEDSMCVCLREFARDLRNPLFLLHIPDGSNRILIVEQVGVVWSYNHLEDWDKQIPRKFLDISDRIHVTNQHLDERGLLGLALHPQFAENNKLYVYYVTVDNNGQEFAILSEIRPLNGLNTERKILRISQPTKRQNGGQILFGLDGYLYVFVGDGGSPGHSPDNAQNKQSLLGKVLRLDVDHIPDTGEQYSIPPDNPFIGLTSTRPEIYALGLRNSWRCSVDRGHPDTGRGRGRVFCGDVGASKYEEINIIVKGGNYGWNVYEGNACVNVSTSNTCENMDQSFIAPIYVYGHPPKGGAAVVGGYVYRGSAYPSLQGQFVFGDVMSGKISVIKDTQGTWQGQDLPVCPANQCPCNARYQSGNFILSFGEDNAGELYALIVDGLFAGHPLGSVVQLVPPTGQTETCSATRAASTATRTSAMTSAIILAIVNVVFMSGRIG